MAALATIAFYLTVVAYTAASTLFYVDLVRREGAAQAARWAPAALAIGACAHAGHVVTASLLSNVCPVESTHFALSLSALIAVGVYLSMRRRARIDAMGVVVGAGALAFVVVAQFVGAETSRPHVSRTLLALHVTANLLGVSFFLLAGASGAFYLWHERMLKTKRVATSGRLPALDTLDRTEDRLLLAGFPLLTFGVLTGAVFGAGLPAPTGLAAARAALGYATWALVAAVLVLRRTAGWRGRRAAYGTLAGVFCVMLVVGVYIARSSGGV